MAISYKIEFVFCWKLHAPWMGSLEVWIKYIFMYSLFSHLPHVCREMYWTLRHCRLSVHLISSVTTQIYNLWSLLWGIDFHIDVYVQAVKKIMCFYGALTELNLLSQGYNFTAFYILLKHAFLWHFQTNVLYALCVFLCILQEIRVSIYPLQSL